MMKSKWGVFVCGLVLVLLGLITNENSFIPAIYKYISGGAFIAYALFLISRKNNNKTLKK